ncbi:GTP-dependent dephospho-CoA kinase family protein [Halorientalis salina]|uniref:GTP-dependent dephospho-CoA kinase family protein n=1 Tax=Halorientalis salina TaxID=2932266 RepID=UPI002022A118|nr:DUF359 domain-containing protein [Halorientalis salina]
MTDDTLDDAAVVVELQAELRSELKEPVGPIYTDTDAMLAEAERPLIAVGDIVTYHLMTAERMPDVALVDGKTKRSAVEDHIRAEIDGGAFDRERRVSNPPGTLSADLLTALRDAITDAAEGRSTVIVVDGEEDLAALPAVVAAPTGASVVYGQPDEGMVLVTCEGEAVDRMRDLLGRMDGDTERLWAILDVAG